MDQGRFPAVQVVIGSLGQSQNHFHGGASDGTSNGVSNGMPRPVTRPLLVDEALQFSPMSTAPVFGLGECLPRLVSSLNPLLLTDERFNNSP